MTIETKFDAGDTVFVIDERSGFEVVLKTIKSIMAKAKLVGRFDSSDAFREEVLYELDIERVDNKYRKEGVEPAYSFFWPEQELFATVDDLKTHILKKIDDSSSTKKGAKPVSESERKEVDSSF